MDEGATQSQSSNPGARLAAAREHAGMTLQQAAESLRLDVATLQALEAGRFQALGAAVFVRGHLRHYAELVGLPAGEIDAAYEACSAQLAPLPDLRRTTTLPGTPASRGVALPPRAALIGAIVLVLIALVWWAMRVPTGQRHAANAAASSSASASSSAPPTSAPSPRQGADAGPETPVAAAPPTARSEPAGTRTEAAAGAKNSTPASKDAAAAKEAAAARTMVRLAIRFNQNSWAEIYDARRVTLYHDFGGAGSERRLTGAAPLRVLIGNPDGVVLELDGHPVALRPAAESGKPQRFLLDSTGRMSDIPGSQSQSQSQSQRTAPAPAAPEVPPEESAPSAAAAPATRSEPP
ncbi:MAG: helix-turn-helix domain-containing protein [Steroidobacterales bacterium]